ncbi:MAG: PKD domain-containing protein [Saprospiraceae bacterium]|nr:PKD domain-containing protein [Saprospiraceae bacterium]
MKFLAFYFCCLPLWVCAQKFDNTWLLGNLNDTILSNNRGIQVLTFQEGHLEMAQNTQLYRFNFAETNTSLSDSSGNILSYSNGVHIGDAGWKIMDGGDSLTNAYEWPGEIYTQWVVMLPFPDNPTLQMVLYEQEGFSPEISFHATKLYYALIDMAQNQGLGAMVERDQLLIEDTLAVGKISSVKHANGRDWWVFVNEKNSNHYYRLLLSPQGIEVVGNQAIGATVWDGVGQSVFSPNGAYFAVYGTVSVNVGAYLDLYDFDRCSGLFSNHRQFHFPERNWGGLAFSPNSRHLYLNRYTKAFQYDLQAQDVFQSQTLVAEYDGFQNPFNTTFYNMQLAPDGKIYSSTPEGSTNSLHVIHFPDEPGMACHYQQHGIQLLTRNSWSLPTFPHFRLGPLDGSSCDTLGLDNRPVAFWRSEKDTLEPLLVHFHDLSYYEPDTWLWDFGDGFSSTERHPEHIFPGPGVYEVCLTASNSDASHTLCRMITFTITKTVHANLGIPVSVGPNPFRDYLLVAFSAPLESPVFHLYDQTGRLVRRQTLIDGNAKIETYDLPNGVYFWEIKSVFDHATGRVLKQ